MAMQRLFNGHGLLLSPSTVVSYGPDTLQTSPIMNATNEVTGTVGRVSLQNGTAGGSKTISSSGGKIHFCTAGVTWANAGTNLRVGIQDVDPTTGLPDLTFDVQADLVPGTETITANNLQTIAMESGSKTIAHGDLICVMCEMTARGGTDSVTVRAQSTVARNYCYSIGNTGAGIAKFATAPGNYVIEFDDGTVGFFNQCWVTPANTAFGTAVSFNNTSTPDEVALVFSLPVPSVMNGIFLPLNAVTAPTDTFEIILYTDPLGTPAAAQTYTMAGIIYGANAGLATFCVDEFGPISLAANTPYALALRPTSANDIQYYEMIFGAAGANCIKATPLGTNWYKGERSDQTGAFTPTTTTLPNFSFYLSEFSDGVGGGSVGIIGGT